jgi:hypothetical protein
MVAPQALDHAECVGRPCESLRERQTPPLRAGLLLQRIGLRMRGLTVQDAEHVLHGHDRLTLDALVGARSHMRGQHHVWRREQRIGRHHGLQFHHVGAVASELTALDPR